MLRTGRGWKYGGGGGRAMWHGFWFPTVTKPKSPHGVQVGAQEGLDRTLWNLGPLLPKFIELLSADLSFLHLSPWSGFLGTDTPMAFLYRLFWELRC